MATLRNAPPGSGPCAKQTVVATVVAANGDKFVGTNHCMTPRGECARAGMATGVGYELCRSVCSQTAHAEINALELAGECARGSTLYVEGHTYACESCRAAAMAAGVAGIVMGPPPADQKEATEAKDTQ